jgi:hypothetical protein
VTTDGFPFLRRATIPKSRGVIFLEHGVHGSNAASIARHVMDTFFAKQEGRPLPPKPTIVPNLKP